MEATREAILCLLRSVLEEILRILAVFREDDDQNVLTNLYGHTSALQLECLEELVL